MSELSGTAGKDATVVEFPDNRLLGALFGEHDRHLSRIEQQMGVSLTPRGNRVAIAGSADARAATQQVLRSLYTRLQRGEAVETGDVEGAIRLASAEPDSVPAGDLPVIRTRKRQIGARSPTQASYIRELFRNELVFGIGPAGTGKTYLAVAAAVSMKLSGKVDRIILSRPAVEAGERLGFLPGDMKDKVDPYLRPLYDALYDMLPGELVVKLLESGEIEVAPLAFMRGRTLANSFVILDEAQNTSPVQMKMFLTRMGENSRMVITGDLSQIDLPIGVPSGLRDALDILDDVPGIATVRFGEADVVRHSLVTRIVKAYGARDRDLGLDAQGDTRGGRRR